MYQWKWIDYMHFWNSILQSTVKQQFCCTLYTWGSWHTNLVTLKDMSGQGVRSIKLRIFDIDIMVIAIALFPRLELNKLWIELGSGKSKVFHPIYLIYKNLGSKKSKTVLFLCVYWIWPSVSISTCAKKNVAWKTWKRYPKVTEKFIKLGDLPSKEFAELSVSQH